MVLNCALKLILPYPAVDSTGQSFEFDFGRGDYVRDIARARTFGFTGRSRMLLTNGLALGGGLDNAIVMDASYKVLNSDGFTLRDEFVKHKILMQIGDLYLIGHPIWAHTPAFRSGHAMNNQSCCGPCWPSPRAGRR